MPPSLADWLPENHLALGGARDAVAAHPGRYGARATWL